VQPIVQPIVQSGVKLFLIGATGFVGSEVLSQLIAHPRVTQVTCPTRRPLEPTSSKLVALQHQDFARYDDLQLESYSDHVGCIWTLGGKASDFASEPEYLRITHTFALAFASTAFAHASGPFAFCYLSGLGADPSQTSRLPWEKLTRYAKGRAEKDLQALAQEHLGCTVHCFRPGGILKKGTPRWVDRVFGRWVVRVDRLASALIETAIDPFRDA
jgi:nucleoside-diphosphate-sugar epimerase